MSPAHPCFPQFLQLLFRPLSSQIELLKFCHLNLSSQPGLATSEGQHLLNKIVSKGTQVQSQQYAKSFKRTVKINYHKAQF